MNDNLFLNASNRDRDPIPSPAWKGRRLSGRGMWVVIRGSFRPA